MDVPICCLSAGLVPDFFKANLLLKIAGENGSSWRLSNPYSDCPSYSVMPRLNTVSYRIGERVFDVKECQLRASPMLARLCAKKFAWIIYGP